MKRVFKVLALGVVLGLVCALLQESLNMDQATFLKWFWIFALTITAGAALLNILYHLYYRRKVKGLLAQLEQGHPQVYIDGIEQLLRTAKGRPLRESLTLHLATGYMESQRFDLAIPILEEMIHRRRRNSVLSLICCIDLCSSYFKTEQYEKALKLCQAHQTLLESSRRHRTYGPYITLVDVMTALAQEDYPQAEALLHAAAQTKTTPRIQDSLEKLSHTMEAMKAGQSPAQPPVSPK